MTAKPMTKERRLHDRLEVRSYATFVDDVSGTSLPVGNLGYSGMLLAGALPGGERPRGEIAGRIKVLDLDVRASGNVVRASAEGLGVVFDHSSGELLETLRLVLDPARYGATMVTMNKSYVAEAYRGAEWLVLQGLGPTVLTARFASPEHADVKEFALTIRPGGYHVVEFRDGELSVGVMKEGVAGFKTAAFDGNRPEHRMAVRRAASVLLGMSGLPVARSMAPLVALLAGRVGGSTLS